MGDSEDEYDKRIRDKFRGERTESLKGGDVRRDDRRPRDEWMEREAWSNRSRGRPDYRNTMRDKYSPLRHDVAPATKRMRTDWEDRRLYDASNSSNYSYSAWLPAESQAPSAVSASRTGNTVTSSVDVNSDTQPPMMSLKAFINTLDDTISDEEALKKYNEYKIQFRKQQLNEFFVAHKLEEWFKDKYHPVNSTQRKEQHLNNLNKRLQVFQDFLKEGKLDNVSVDADQSQKLVKLMDAFVILLEGGTENDLTILEDTPQTNQKLSSASKPSTDSGSSVKAKTGETSEQKENEINDQTVTTTQEDEKEAEPAAVETIEVKDDSDDESKEALRNRPKPLHKTSSIFLRNLSPNVTKAEIEEVCKKYNGFLRVALADPQPDRKWYRRGWITFERDVNIKDICWNLTNVRVKDNELNPIVNRDLSRRVRTVSNITNNKHVVRNDMKLCVQIIQNLDKKYNLWRDGDAPESQSMDGNKNPVLQNITSYLIEEASAEEEALLGENETNEEVDEQDPKVFQALDRMLLYLRLVHSVDYYNHCEYPNEDEMPNRCGIIHARIMAQNVKVTSDEVAEYCKCFKGKLEHLLEQHRLLNDEEIIPLGMKNAETEVDKFITSNTQELAADKWLCPLSGKKFKGPEFVRKHILNKYADKVEEVKQEVEYYNNYLRDPKRPQLPEHPGNKSGPKPADPAASTVAPNTVMPQAHPPYQFGYGAGVYTAGYGRGMGYGGYNRPMRPYGGRGGSRSGNDFRPIINYRDLDAPKEPEEYL